MNKMDKENVICMYNGILFSHKKEILSYATIWMQLGSIMLSKLSQPQK